MKLADILLLGMCLVFIVIGVDQTLAFGFQNSYWAFMLALTLFFVFTLRKSRITQNESDQPPGKDVNKPRSGTKKR